MNRKLISKAISDIEDSLIEEAMVTPAAQYDHTPERTTNMGKYEPRKTGVSIRRMIGLIAAACLWDSETVQD